ncbi:MAG: glycosyltransferase family 2 protein [Butyrivibrio sp.]|nr:glycosyltransferase family 2 protein [Butyrivibrio sp.]
MAGISIIITVYNTAKYLDECINPVLDQTFRDLEIILVDDGSTDGISPQKCDEYAGKDDRVRVIHKENGGLQSAWIAGLIQATSEYISFIDSDDWIDTEMMGELYKLTLAGNGKGGAGAGKEIISGNYIVEKAGERRKETQALAPGEYTGQELEKVKENLLGCEIRPVTMSRCMKLISRKLLLDNIRYCDPTIVMGEDVNITLPCLCDCERLVIADGAYFYHYRLLRESMSHAYNPGLLKNLELTDLTFREILKSKKISTADEQLDREFVMMLLVVMRNVLRADNRDTLGLVKEIFLRRDIRQKVLGTKVEIKGKSNRLIYYTMKYPGAVTVGIAKMIINAYDRRTN